MSSEALKSDKTNDPPTDEPNLSSGNVGGGSSASAGAASTGARAAPTSPQSEMAVHSEPLSTPSHGSPALSPRSPPPSPSDVLDDINLPDTHAEAPPLPDTTTTTTTTVTTAVTTAPSPVSPPTVSTPSVTPAAIVHTSFQAAAAVAQTTTGTPGFRGARVSDADLAAVHAEDWAPRRGISSVAKHAKGFSDLLELGFSEEAVDVALAKAGNDFDRAVEILINSAESSSMLHVDTSELRHTGERRGERPGGDGLAGFAEDRRSAPASPPRRQRTPPLPLPPPPIHVCRAAMDEVVRVIKARPNLLAELLMRLGQLNGALMDILMTAAKNNATRENEPDLFAAAQTSKNNRRTTTAPSQSPTPKPPNPIPNTTPPTAKPASAAAPTPATPATPGGTSSGGATENVARLTDDEKRSISKLVAMGFALELAIEGFLVSDRNEERAVAYLLQLPS